VKRRELTLLLGLADGSLPDQRRAEARAWLVARPERERQLARQRRAIQAARGAAPAAPPALERRVTADLRRAGASRRGAGLLRPVAVATTAFALAIAALAIGLSMRSDPAPSVLAVVNLGRNGPVAPPPPTERDRPELLDREFAGVTFPNWSETLGWVPSGVRTDRLDGRRASTVFYTHEGHQVAYTVVDGDALEPPPDARRMVVDGLEHHMLRLRDGRDVVMFNRNGKTCVVAGHVIEQATIHRLAAWNGRGHVRF
jgi:hypothetical protein